MTAMAQRFARQSFTPFFWVTLALLLAAPNVANAEGGAVRAKVRYAARSFAGVEKTRLRHQCETQRKEVQRFVDGLGDHGFEKVRIEQRGKGQSAISVDAKSNTLIVRPAVTVDGSEQHIKTLSTGVLKSLWTRMDGRPESRAQTSKTTTDTRQTRPDASKPRAKGDYKTRYKIARTETGFEKANRDQLAQQQKAVEAFIKRLDTGLEGQPIGLFDDVRIEPRDSYFGPAMKIDHIDRTLIIRPRLGKRGTQVEVMDAEKLESLWNKGEAVGLARPARILAATPLLGGKVKLAKKAWTVFNPIGPLRMNLKNAVKGSIARLTNAIRELRTNGSVAELKRELILLVTTMDSGFKPEGASQTLAKQTTTFLRTASKPQLQAFVTALQRYIQRPDLKSAIADSVLSHKPQNWKQVQAALIAISQVQNHKKVQVRAELSLNGGRHAFNRYVKETVEPGKRSLWQVAGIVGSQVQLVDDVSVHASAALTSGKVGAALPTAAIDYALEVARATK
jgi:hypothetical protein